MNSCQASTSGPKKLIQISEQFQEPVHVPIVIGSDCFVVTQQDMRKIEDVRLLSYHKLGANGELIPINEPLIQNNTLCDALQNAARLQNQSNNDVLFQQLIKLIGQNSCTSPPPCPTRASVAQMMEWEHTPQSSTPAYPFTYNKSTSIDDMPRQVKRSVQQPCQCSCTPRYVVHEACNTVDETSTDDSGLPSAKQMLKLRKQTEDTLGV